MPTYTFYDKDTDEQFDEFMSWSEREKSGERLYHISPLERGPAPGNIPRVHRGRGHCSGAVWQVERTRRRLG